MHEKVRAHATDKLAKADKTIFMIDKILKHLDTVISKYTNEMENQQVRRMEGSPVPVSV